VVQENALLSTYADKMVKFLPAAMVHRMELISIVLQDHECSASIVVFASYYLLHLPTGNGQAELC